MVNRRTVRPNVSALTILIPTTGRREEMLRIVTCAYVAQHPDAEILTCEGFSWGYGLNELAPKASGEYLLCGCDDTLPHAGWFEAGRAMLDAGQEPASRYFRQDGAPLHDRDVQAHGTAVGWCRSFLLTPAIFREVGPFIDATWYADGDYSERLETAGWPIVAGDGFAWTHLDGERDWQTEERGAYELERYMDSHRARGIGV